MSYEQMQNNRVFLSGTVASAPEFTHEVMGEGFYDFVLSVDRLSGQVDEIPVTISERLMENNAIDIGNVVGICGQLRSYNKVAEGKSKLVLRVFVRELCEPDPDVPNYIEMEGYVCKQPVYRTTPFGREICDLLIAVNRAYNKSDYIPAIAWGRNARYSETFSVGEKVKIEGRIQSRNYQKVLDDGAVEERTAYEVSVAKIEK